MQGVTQLIAQIVANYSREKVSFVKWAPGLSYKALFLSIVLNGRMLSWLLKYLMRKL